MMKFSPQDEEMILKHGCDVTNVAAQLERFKQGFPFARLNRAAVIDDGIVRLSADEVEEIESDYEAATAGLQLLKFVPASGAATRMFKDLYAMLSDDNEALRDKAMKFLNDLPVYPFYEDLSAVMKKAGLDIEKARLEGDYKLVIRYLLQEEGLDYGHKPKGMLAFHRYDNEIRTSLEEHLVEAALYANNGGKCQLHFTISPAHKEGFEALVHQVVPKYEARFGVTYNITFSEQDPATDTIAVNPDNTPFRDDDGHLLFRPAGHGALIHNLNKMDADVVFVKNIDNVITENRIAPTIRYKKVLAGYLIQLQQRVFSYLKRIDQGDVDEMLLCEMMDFAESQLQISLGDDCSVEALYDKLNRPLRICGMVKNEGEPGGGPFWMEAEDNTCSLQIVESSQINKADDHQRDILEHATHFNPVDLVCGIKDYKGQKFNLPEYVDPETGFISSKSYNGRDLKAMELPGLWNGAMSDWITVFVEVPIETFNPVKTVFDLHKRNVK
ncbi:MAG: DUF4301 family protein [Bacteroidales bacterium]|nr:DUF4301 family protein [Bacteroidales bacterium]